MMTMKKQRKEGGEDLISQLPQPLLHEILCFLSQKQAVQTCVLSKSWRHLVSTRPRIQFGKDFFNGDEEEKYLSVLDKTFQRYHHQKLSIKEFIIDGMKEGPKSFELLEKWVPIALPGANKFHLSIDSSDEYSEPAGNLFRLQSSVLLKAEFLKELVLGNCRIDSLVDDKVLFKNLRKLSLGAVYISDEALEKITSSCPLFEDLDIRSCVGFKTIKMTKAHNLKFFQFSSFSGKEGCHSIEIIDAPSIESITIFDCPNWIHNPDMYFPRLKSLCLYRVRLSNESIDKFSTNLPCLEELRLSFFSGSEQIFQLSSRSIKHLTIAVEGSSLKAAIIDAPNILSFEFTCEFLPSSISFTTTSTEWKSEIFVIRSTLDFDNGASSWFHRLSEICKALSTSQISLHFDYIPQVVPKTHGDLICQPFVIENLILEEKTYSPTPDFFICLFRNFRPRNIVHKIWVAGRFYKGEYQLIELLRKILLLESERAQCFGQLNLEDAKMEAFYEKDKEWRGVEGTSSLLESDVLTCYYNQKFRFRLKWKTE